MGANATAGCGAWRASAGGPVALRAWALAQPLPADAPRCWKAGDPCRLAALCDAAHIPHVYGAVAPEGGAAALLGDHASGARLLECVLMDPRDTTSPAMSRTCLAHLALLVARRALEHGDGAFLRDCAAAGGDGLVDALLASNDKTAAHPLPAEGAGTEAGLEVAERLLVAAMPAPVAW